MSRVATEARSRATAQWISEAGPRWTRTTIQASSLASPHFSPLLPSEGGLQRQQLRRTRKPVAVHYYQLLSGHAAIGPYLRDKTHEVDSDNCWWYEGGERQSGHHHFTRCRVWAPQARRMWKYIGKACGWKHPRIPSAKWLWRRQQRRSCGIPG